MEQDRIILQINDKITKEVNFIELKDLKDLNKAITDGWTKNIVNISELLMDMRIGKIAETISSSYSTPKFVLISGPSSSGKTTFSKRLSLHLMARGMKPFPISIDDYFVDRVKTPIDENGEYDYESVHSVDIDLFNEHLDRLTRGEEIELPRYDFPTGTSQKSGHKLRMEEGMILLLEGIHALNPLLTAQIDDSLKFKVYVSALTQIAIDDQNMVHSSDNRLIRRIVRDNRTRGISPEDNILRWPSVRRGETRNIFPFEENADIVFNSSTLYDIPLLRYYAEPLLYGISEASPAYEKAHSLLNFLDHVTALKPSEIAAIPPTSIMREFIGGQRL